eukprot:TRINITY_DN2741_c0_g1_i1.p1 TRINITY_DN2741_c0_g1~~TRINITY_DN2741_c0_g1_i1.p1  ORF type:complete len:644 (+),score=223.31 TRINITY_DN2741_c0_g1_i1:81-2012(+)
MTPPAAKKPKTDDDAQHDAQLQAWLDASNAEYERLHLAFENDFWGTKMGLKGFTPESLTATKGAMEAWLRDKGNLARAAEWTAGGKGSDAQKLVLRCLERTFRCYTMDDPDAETMKGALVAAETALEAARGGLKVGLTEPGADGKFLEMSSVALRNRMRTCAEEPMRRAAYEELRAIGKFVVGAGFIDIVKRRNALARKLSYEDFYDYKVTAAEGFGKRRLFEIMDGLEERTRPQLERARAALSASKGASALEPFNLDFAMAGDLEARADAYFPFERAVEAWGRTFAALGIRYEGATMALDLLDRKGKYSNGFCHWPQPAWVKPDGSWVPSKANFTSLADPAAVGSGKTGLRTLLHEGGHAAHFACIRQPSPLFSQERAPTSVAYAENQSMFLDSLMGDAAWLGRYARDRGGGAMPWELVEQMIKATHPYEVFLLRSMLAVPYFEKALYEMADEDLTPEAVLELADSIETKIQGGAGPRPLLCVPHILSDESSCYYHGYVLAEMSVHQTRAHFLKGGGRIVDNPDVGRQLTDIYWRPGNSRAFLDLVEELTGAPLSGDAWVAALEETVDAKVASERKEYEWASTQPDPYAGGGDINLDMRMRIVHGDEDIADSQEPGSFLAACGQFKEYVRQHYPATAAAGAS